MTGISDELIAELRTLLTEATPGPWAQEPDTAAGRVWVRLGKQFGNNGDLEPLFMVRSRQLGKRAEFAQREADAALIVAAINGLPALLERVEAAERGYDAIAVMRERLLERLDITEADRDALAAKVADIRALVEIAERHADNDLSTMSVRAHIAQTQGTTLDEGRTAWPAMVSTTDLRAAFTEGTEGA